MATEAERTKLNFKPELVNDEKQEILNHEIPREWEVAFKALRGEGLITVMGDVCCNNCTTHAIGEYCRSLVEDGNEIGVKGYVYFHSQNCLEEVTEERWDEWEGRYVYHDTIQTNFDTLYLGYGIAEYWDSEEKEMVQLPDSYDSAEEVAETAIEVFELRAFDVEWDGDEDTKLKVHRP